MSLHTLCAKLHKYFGLVLLLFLLVEGVTGAVLVFHDPLDETLNRDLFLTHSQGPVRPAAALADALQRAHPQWHITETLLQVASGHTVPMQVRMPSGAQQVFVDPHTGAIVGQRSPGPGWDRRHIMEGLLEFHGNWMMGTFGRWLIGMVAVGWVLTNLIGLYLSFPVTGPFWSRWMKNWRINRGTKLLRFTLDVHRAGSLWLFLGLMILAITSVEINFYTELFAPVVNALWHPSPTPFDAGAPRPAPGRVARLSFSQAVQTATRQAAIHPGWQASFMTHSGRMGLYGVSFVRPGADTYSRLGPVAYYVDDVSGKVSYTDDPYHEGAHGLVVRSLYPLHSGRVFGWPTRILVLILGLFTAILSISGGYLWWRKRKKSRGADGRPVYPEMGSVRTNFSSLQKLQPVKILNFKEERLVGDRGLEPRAR